MRYGRTLPAPDSLAAHQALQTACIAGGGEDKLMAFRVIRRLANAGDLMLYRLLPEASSNPQ